VGAAEALARGSARSYGDLDVRAALQACAPLLLRFGGHRAAGGVTLLRREVPAFVEAFDVAVAALRTGVEEGDAAVALHDGEVDLGLLDAAFVEAVRSVGPYGVGFPPPRFVLQGVRIERARVVGERHVAFEIAVSRGSFIEAIAFGKGHLGLQRGDLVHFTYTPELRTFRGRTRIQLVVDRLWRG
jgi:single-stranded-DNA-specific exonuclease